MTPTDRDKDQQLVASMIAGDTGAFSTIYLRYHQPLLRFLQQSAKSPALAEDLLHDTFVRLWEHRGQLDPTQPLKPYLYTIARNQFLNLLKRARHEARILDEMKAHALVESENILRTINYKETKQLIDEALGQLPPRCLAVFQKCHFEELTYKQAAQSLGISESTVHNQMVKALHHIRRHITLRNSLTTLLAAIAVL